MKHGDYILPDEIEWEEIDSLTLSDTDGKDLYVILFSTGQIRAGVVHFLDCGPIFISLDDDEDESKYPVRRSLRRGDMLCWLADIRPQLDIHAQIAKKKKELEDLESRLANTQGDI